jgi:hypothetical protein
MTLIRSGGVLAAQLTKSELIVFSESGATERWPTKRLSSGGNNTVVMIPSQRLVVRFSTQELSVKDQVKYIQEIEAQTALAAASLSPPPMSVIHLVDRAKCSFRLQPYAHPARIGIVMQQYDADLDAVIQDPAMTAKLFVENDGEERIVALFARASSIATCVDTKCANVMVSFATATTPLELVLIDLDVMFCGTSARAITADYTIRAIEDAMRAFSTGDRSDSTYALCACAVSLLILCMDISKRGGSTVMIETTAMLIRNIHIIVRLLAEDDAAVIFPKGRPSFMWMGASVSAVSQIRYYTSIKAAGYIPIVLGKSLESPYTKLLLTCRSAKDGATYIISRKGLDQKRRKK